MILMPLSPNIDLNCITSKTGINEHELLIISNHEKEICKHSANKVV